MDGQFFNVPTPEELIFVREDPVGVGPGAQGGD
jgi:hypothetical protein